MDIKHDKESLQWIDFIGKLDAVVDSMLGMVEGEREKAVNEIETRIIKLREEFKEQTVKESKISDETTCPDNINTPRKSTRKIKRKKYFDQDYDLQFFIKTEVTASDIKTKLAEENELSKDQVHEEETNSNISNDSEKVKEDSAQDLQVECVGTEEAKHVEDVINDRIVLDHVTGELITEEDQEILDEEGSGEINDSTHESKEDKDISIDEDTGEGKIEYGSSPLKRGRGRPKGCKNAQSTKGETELKELLTCGQCEFKTKSQDSLNRHELLKHNATINCHKCEKPFSVHNQYLTHMLRDHEGYEYPCSQCDKVFTFAVGLKRHMASKHTDPSTWTILCTTCGKAFPTTSQLANHKYVHVNQPDKYKCDECDHCTKSQFLLKKHKENIHTPDREVFHCKICDKTIRYQESYNCHMRRHTGERPYQCDVCEAAFPSQASLSRHKRIHGPPKFQCSTCGKQFHTAGAVTRHSAVHKEAAQLCPWCPFKTTFAANLRRHCQNKHNETHPPVDPSKKPIICTPHLPGKVTRTFRSPREVYDNNKVRSRPVRKEKEKPKRKIQKVQDDDEEYARKKARMRRHNIVVLAGNNEQHSVPQYKSILSTKRAKSTLNEQQPVTQVVHVIQEEDLRNLHVHLSENPSMQNHSEARTIEDFVEVERPQLSVVNAGEENVQAINGNDNQQIQVIGDNQQQIQFVNEDGEVIEYSGLMQSGEQYHVINEEEVLEGSEEHVYVQQEYVTVQMRNVNETD